MDWFEAGGGWLVDVEVGGGETECPNGFGKSREIWMENLQMDGRAGGLAGGWRNDANAKIFSTIIIRARLNPGLP